MINCIMKMVMSNKEFFMEEINQVKRTPVQENAFSLVIKKGLGQK